MSYTLHSGSTPPGQTEWRRYEEDPSTIYVDVDTSSAGFAGTPRYVASLLGERGHYGAVGVSSIYAPTSRGFRVYVRRACGSRLTPEGANALGWAVAWFGLEGEGAGGTSRRRGGVLHDRITVSGDGGLGIQIDGDPAGALDVGGDTALRGAVQLTGIEAAPDPSRLAPLMIDPESGQLYAAPAGSLAAVFGIPDQAGWAAAGGGQIPPGAQSAGQDAAGESLYLARATLEGGAQAGWVRAGGPLAHVPMGNGAGISPYEVLIGQQSWAVRAADGAAPAGAISIGRLEEQAVYPIRASVAGGLFPGAWTEGATSARVHTGEEVVEVEDFEVLIEPGTKTAKRRSRATKTATRRSRATKTATRRSRPRQSEDS